ncbi:MAG: hypothetical protein COW18_14515 [Zetaproteobacteria bacterium CG12_big_fil_rev_8_21_14_0_65_54_13]|nr:MAG: hypothetical protein COX55_08815 [Zetaproteobacteria bacterium CG23_combo_of_CG06-09_8_20_14_all_54_7]PIW44031.1 MAG: hypothetical protein COW18_14515 [Zetaproteobacteria bacterium CG12_big_fil_rev_8_21_14_0_65_54_13]PIX54365.1 MAG: hypothetical protein COZ50_08650 [Zetaproteobacteria bacterium CG_4_10_14_3_um_filter_54_28]PJA28568.1 MAG: hypothetical protein CO188_09305 [Zetaproteobacteria bacterium CG_4_9_14_3_um_filter_54_145]
MFWKEKAMSEMSDDEWESLCDGCGRCCVWKFEDEDTAEILYTDIRCQQFNESTCRCTDYPQRTTIEPECMDIRALEEKQFAWLPESCAYRLLHEGKPLFDWHPLISGDKQSVHTAGISLQHKTTSPEGITEEDIIRHIIDPDEARG